MVRQAHHDSKGNMAAKGKLTMTTEQAHYDKKLIMTCTRTKKPHITVRLSNKNGSYLLSRIVVQYHRP